MRERHVDRRDRRTMWRACLFLLLLLVASSFSTRQATACLNPIGQNQVGTRIEVDNLSASAFIGKLMTHHDKAFWLGTMVEFESRKKHHPRHVDPNNVAVSMVHLGQVREAIDILEQHERSKPGVYQTAANLGTAFELNGENEKALEWIAEGVRRNPQGHNGTEWLHVKILKAKIALDDDPQWLVSNSVLGLDLTTVDRDSNVSLVDDLGFRRTLADIESALVYQLHERLEFVRPPDPVVADLLYDLGAIFALTRTNEHSAAVRELALSYGPGHQRNILTASVTPEAPAVLGTGNSPFILIATALAALAMVLLGIYAFMRERRSGERMP
jgi:hypothetical protein